VRLWQIATGKRLTTLTGHAGRVYKAAFSPDGARLATASWDGTVRTWDLATPDPRAAKDGTVCTGHSGAVYDVAVSPDGVLLYSGSADGSVRVWDAVTCRAVARFEGEGGAIYDVAVSPDGLRLASAGADGAVRVRSLAPAERASVDSPGAASVTAPSAGTEMSVLRRIPGRPPVPAPPVIELPAP
jgi:WD40 repeat protein